MHNKGDLVPTKIVTLNLRSIPIRINYCELNLSRANALATVNTEIRQCKRK
jgi:hypothetical protein